MGYIGGGHDQYYGNKGFHHLGIDRFGHKKVLSGPRVCDKSNGVRTCIGAYMFSYPSGPSSFSLYYPGSDPVIFRKDALFNIYISNVCVGRCSMSTHIRGMLRL